MSLVIDEVMNVCTSMLLSVPQRSLVEGQELVKRIPRLINNCFGVLSKNIALCADVKCRLPQLSRPSEKFRFEPSRKFLLTAVRLKDGTNRDEPRGTRSAGLVEASQVGEHDATGSG